MRKMKKKRLVMLTAYDCPSAKICDEAGVDIILVGDSAANVIHGMKSTRGIGMPEMLSHVKAVSRAKPRAPVIADMPYKSDSTPKTALKNAKAFLKAGAKAVKLEGMKIPEIKSLVKNKINVMGHLGYLPQTDKKPKVKGRKENDAERLLRNAIELEKAGCSWLVLELVPEKLSKKIAETLSIPVIGIGAGRFVDGQVLVFHDLLGLNPDENFRPRFLKRYASLKKQAIKAISKFADEVREGKFPSKKNTY
ncbi:MAG: 3-methyl-2-oxobutanoate hydroxymethyltransferase [archaeon]